DVDRHCAPWQIEDDRIAILDCCNWPPVEGFRGNVARHEAASGPGKTAIGQKRNGLAKTRANKSRGHAQHFAHSGATTRALVANDDDIARLDLAFLNGGKGGFFPVEDTRRAAEILGVVADYFHHATFRREIALQDEQAAARF